MAARPVLRVAGEPKAAPAPTHLRAATRRWWAEVVGAYDLEPHHRLLLQATCESWDRMTEAREALKRDGSYLPDRYGGRKAHPALNVERDNRVIFARLIRELDLDGEPAPDPHRATRASIAAALGFPTAGLFEDEAAPTSGTLNTEQGANKITRVTRTDTPGARREKGFGTRGNTTTDRLQSRLHRFDSGRRLAARVLSAQAADDGPAMNSSRPPRALRRTVGLRSGVNPSTAPVRAPADRSTSSTVRSWARPVSMRHIAWGSPSRSSPKAGSSNTASGV